MSRPPPIVRSGTPRRRASDRAPPRECIWQTRSNRRRSAILLLQLLGLGAGALLLRPELGSELLTEVFGLVERPDLELLAVERRALEPRDRLVHRLHLPQPEAGDQLLGLGERSVDDGRLASREPDPLALGGRLQALAGLHDAGLDQLLVEVPHLGQRLMGRQHTRLGILGRFHDHHDSHVRLLVCPQWGDERGWARSTRAAKIILASLASARSVTSTPHVMVRSEGCMRAAPVWLLVSVVGGCASAPQGPVSPPPDAPAPVVGADAPIAVTVDAPIITSPPPDAAAGVIFDP